MVAKIRCRYHQRRQPFIRCSGFDQRESSQSVDFHSGKRVHHFKGIYEAQKRANGIRCIIRKGDMHSERPYLPET